MNIIIPFDFRRLECRDSVFLAIVTSIVYADDTYVKSSIEELVEEQPNRDKLCEHLLTLAMRCYDELAMMLYAELRPLYREGYEVIQVKQFCADTLLVMEQVTYEEDSRYI